MIFIITAVYNRKEFTRNYLKALSQQTSKDFKVIIVDDGSSDGTSEMIEEEFPNIILLKEKGDLWWAEATNIGVRYALEHGADYIMTLNDDTVPRVDFIEKMLLWIEKKPNVLLGAFAVDENNGDAVYGGEIRSCITGKSTHLIKTLQKEQMHGLHKVNLFPGRGLMMPAKVFDDIGMYDSKNFPQTLADLDFTCRAGNAGYEMYCNYDAVVGIYPEESGGIYLMKKKSFSNYYKHLFDLKGGGNIIRFSIFAIKNVPFYYLPIFLMRGLSARLLSYWLKK